MSATPAGEKPASDATVYLFSGEVDARRAAAVEGLISHCVDPEFASFDLERFDGGDVNADSIIAAASGMPFGSARKTVIVDRVERLAEEDQVRIAEFISHMGDFTCLILMTGEEKPRRRQKPKTPRKGETVKPAGPASSESEDSEDEEGGKSGGVSSKLTKAVKAKGQVVTFSKLKVNDLAKLVAQIANRHGKKVEAQALAVLARAVASNPAAIEKEIEKLDAYTADRRTISLEDVEAVVSISPEDRIFPLIDAVAGGRPDLAVHLLQQTMAASTKPDGEVLRVLSMLARHFRLLYQMKFLVSEGYGANPESVPDDVQAMLMHQTTPLTLGDWQKGKFIEQQRSFTLKDLRRCLKLILECELAVKGLGTESGSPRLNLEMLVVKLSGRRGRQPR